MDHQIAVERIIQNLDEPLSEAQFVALCGGLRVTDPTILEWALDELSLCGLLVDDSSYYQMRSFPDMPFRVIR